MESLRSRSWVVVLALLTWALAQVWAANQQRVDRLETRVVGPPATWRMSSRFEGDPVIIARNTKDIT